MRQSEAVGCSSRAQPNLENHTHGDSTGIDIFKEIEIVRDDQPSLLIMTPGICSHKLNRARHILPMLSSFEDGCF